MSITRYGTPIDGGGGGGGGGAPSGPAGGALSGTYPDPGIADNVITSAKIAANAVTTAKITDANVTTAKIALLAVTDAQVAAANKDGAAGTASMRTLGTGAAQATAGNDSRLSDARTPTAHATSHEPGGSDTMAVDAAAAVGSLRTLGTGAAQATAGNDGRLPTSGEKTALTSLTAKLASSYVLLTEALASGTTQPLSIADATFTGRAAGGSVSGSGVVGVVSVSTASSSVETGSSSGQAGLGANTPLADAAFVGQKGISVDITASDGSDILLINVLSTAVADLDAKVYGYLAFRSDLGANLKWRLWYYYRRSSDGVEVAFTPNTSLTNCKLWVPQVFALVDIPVSQGLGVATLAGAAAAKVGPGDIGTTELAASAVTAAKITALTITDALIATANKDGAAGTVSLRTLGTGAAQAAAGNDSRLSDARTPTAHASTHYPARVGVAAGSDPILRGLLNAPDLETLWFSDFYAFVNNGEVTQTLTNAGTVAASVLGASESHPGMISLATGTNTNGGAEVTLGPAAGTSAFLGSAGLFALETWVWLTALSDGTDTYTVYIGAHNSAGATAPTTGVWFQYSHGVNSGQWTLNARNGAGTLSTTNSASAPGAGAWIRLSITFDGTTATFYVNGVSVGTVATANMPTNANATSLWHLSIQKSAGGTARSLVVDYGAIRKAIAR